MRVFIAHSSADDEVARRIGAKLRGRGIEAFVDKDSLPAGQDFDSRIREAIEAADVVVFLITPEAVKPGKYVHNELRVCQARWPNPTGHVLPAMLKDTPLKEIDPYLTETVSILPPKGDIVVGIADAVEALRPRAWKKLTIILAAAAAIAGLVVYWYLTQPPPPPPPPVIQGIVVSSSDSPVSGAVITAGTSCHTVTSAAGAFDLTACGSDVTRFPAYVDVPRGTKDCGPFKLQQGQNQISLPESCEPPPPPPDAGVVKPRPPPCLIIRDFNEQTHCPKWVADEAANPNELQNLASIYPECPSFKMVKCK